MNKNILIQICSKLKVQNLLKFILISKYHLRLIENNPDIYIYHLNYRISKELLLSNASIYHLNYFIKSLLAYKYLNFGLALHYCIQHRNTQGFNMILGSIDVSLDEYNHIYLIDSVRYDNTKAFRIILKIDGIKPSTFKNYCLRTASINGNIKIVELLLNHSRTKIDKSLLEECIENARINKRFLLVGLLEKKLKNILIYNPIFHTKCL